MKESPSSNVAQSTCTPTESTFLLRSQCRRTESAKDWPIILVPAITLLVLLVLSVLSNVDHQAMILPAPLSISALRLGHSQHTDLFTNGGDSIPFNFCSNLTASNVPRAVVLLIRHCEDGNTQRQPDLSRHCNPLGFQRAEHFASLFEHYHNRNRRDGNPSRHYSESSAGVAQRWPTPSHLYALAKSRNMRQFETLVPLSDQIDIEIEMLDYPGVDAMAAAHVRNLNDMCQNAAATSINSTAHMPTVVVTVVAWKHVYIPDLARALGCNHCPATWSDDDFDTVWQLHYFWKSSSSLSGRIHGSNKDDSNENEPPPTYNTRDALSAHWDVYANVVHQNFDPLLKRHHS